MTSKRRAVSTRKLGAATVLAGGIIVVALSGASALNAPQQYVQGRPHVAPSGYTPDPSEGDTPCLGADAPEVCATPEPTILVSPANS